MHLILPTLAKPWSLASLKEFPKEFQLTAIILK